MDKSKLILLVTAIIFCLAASTQSSSVRVYYIAINSSECPTHDTYDECNTLDFYIRNQTDYFTNNVDLEFQTGVHSLHNDISLTIADRSNLSLKGENGEEATIECYSKYSLQISFYHMQNVAIENLRFSNCVSTHKGEFDLNVSKCYHNDIHQNSLLSICNSTNIQLTLIRVWNHKGNGIVLDQINGKLNISGMNVTQGVSQNYSLTSLFLTACHQPTATITDSVFINNTNINSTPHIRFSGGLSIVIKSFDAHVNITNVVFDRNRSPHGLGGNLHINTIVDITDTVITKMPQEFVMIDNCQFKRGQAQEGGAMHTFTKYYYTHSNVVNPLRPFNTVHSRMLIITRSNFSENHANVTGGALFMVYKTSSDGFQLEELRVNITHCYFNGNSVNNSGTSGAIINSIVFMYPGYKRHNQPQVYVYIAHSNFSNNSDHNGLESGSGVIFAKSHKHLELENITIESNNRSGVLAMGSNIVISGNVTIRNNRGYSGGGMLLCQKAVLFLRPYSILNIELNHANHSGGGIFVESECSQSKPICFYQLAFDNMTTYNTTLIDTIHINLVNNTADYAGHQLFGGDIDFCYMIESSTNKEHINDIQVYTAIFHDIKPNISIDDNMMSSVTSMPRRVCLYQKNNTVNCNSTKLQLQKNHFYPGEKFKIPVVIVGQLNGLVPGTVQTEVHNIQCHPCSLDNHQRYQRIENQSHELDYTVYAQENESVTLYLSVQQSVDNSVLLHIPHVNKVEVDIHLDFCPLGFELKNNTCKCNGMLQGKKQVSCNITDHSISRSNSSWIGYYCDHGDVIIAFSKLCPLGYCSELTKIQVKKNEMDQDKQCQQNRTGMVCGQCASGMSIGLGSSNCREDCKNFHLSKIIIFLILGMICIGAIIVLNITITEGCISGIIFYANIIKINSDVLYQSDTLKPPQVIIAWINMDEGISTCFYKEMDAYAKAWLLYTFPLYLWVLTALIIYLSKKFDIVMKLVGKNIVKVLATIILLSYTKLIQALLMSLHFLELDTFNTTSKEIGSIKRWYVDANVKYLEGKHIPLFCMGIFFGILCVGFTMSLLCIQRLQKVSHVRLFRWVTKLKPFFDAYTGPFSPCGRFWTGLLLLMRLLLTIVVSLNILDADNLNILATVVAIVLLLAAAWIVRPGIYTRWTLDFLECSFLLNLLFLCSGTLFLSYYNHTLVQQKKWQPKLTDVSTTIAIATLTGIVLYHMWLRVRNHACTEKIFSHFKRRLFNLRSKFSRHAIAAQFISDGDDEFVANFPAIAQFDRDREPLLVD